MPRKNRRRPERSSRHSKKWLRRLKRRLRKLRAKRTTDRRTRLLRKLRLGRSLSYNEIRFLTFERDDYTCQRQEDPNGPICGWRGKLHHNPILHPRARHLTVHHRNHKHKDHRFDMDRNSPANNTDTWCNWCHRKFHQQYG